MSDCQAKHGWKWIGAPQNGVLGLFPAPHPTDTDSTRQALRNERPHASSDSVQDEIIDPPSVPLAIRLVFLVMELVLAHAAGLLFVWCGSITKTVIFHLTGANVLAEAMYSVVVCFGILFTMARLFQQRGLWLFTKRLGFFWTPVATILASITAQGLLLVYFSTMVPAASDLRHLWPLPHDDKSLALALRSFVFAPLEEELFFRGLVLHLALNRLEGPRRRLRSLDEISTIHNGMFASAFVSAVCFAGVHLANLRHGGDVDVLAQLMCGLLLGFVWGLGFVMRGSLLECVVLHSVNNIFAALASTVLPKDGLASLMMGALMGLVYTPVRHLKW